MIVVHRRRCWNQKVAEEPCTYWGFLPLVLNNAGANYHPDNGAIRVLSVHSSLRKLPSHVPAPL